MLKEILESVGRIDEVAKPKGVVDKKFNVAPKPSKSAFKVGQNVALYRGMGTTDHGKIHALDIKSGGDTGAMVHFVGGAKEFHPYSKLKDSKQYWADEQNKAYTKESVEIEEGKNIDPNNGGSWFPKVEVEHADWIKMSPSKQREIKQKHQTGLKIVNKPVKEDVEIEEGTSGTVIHKVNHEGKVKFITKYAKAAEAVAAKIKANTGKDCHITQHISDKNGFYRLHKEAVESHEDEYDEEKEKREKFAQAMKATSALEKRPLRKVGHSGWERYPAPVKTK